MQEGLASEIERTQTAVVMRRRLDGAPEASPFDERVRALCAPTSEAMAPPRRAEGSGRVIAAAAWNRWRGSPDGRSGWFWTEHGYRGAPTFNLKTDFDGTPRLTPHARRRQPPHRLRRRHLERAARRVQLHGGRRRRAFPACGTRRRCRRRRRSCSCCRRPRREGHALRVDAAAAFPSRYSSPRASASMPLLFKAFSPRRRESRAPADAMEDMTQSETHPAWWVDAPTRLRRRSAFHRVP